MAVTTHSTTLEKGDRPALDEFNRRSCARPDLRHAELSEGVVQLPSPTRLSGHGDPHGLAVTWLGSVCARTPGVRLGLETTITLGPDTQVEPDAFLYRTDERATGSADWTPITVKARRTS
jgi:putative restriction endonuclease